MSNILYVEQLYKFWSWQQFLFYPSTISISVSAFLRLITLPRLELDSTKTESIQFLKEGK